ncbi:mediator of RNA polymerase II transcription subunit 14 isoform X2 [Iris pallida]|uniref:Mediator of RNA polymerase II transcription subunit 14 n=1 Tax=Iris pallida TaxID=29817 RepID=A0AAX6EJK4_IRIPA|nr:mediator of RNA polymerase II transcription subunit 14 isoform X2 [Iris pallida]
MAAELGQQTVEFSALVQRTAEDSYLSLKELVEKSSKPPSASGEERSDSEKKIALLKFVAKTRQRMLRLHVLAKWCQQVPLVHYCQQLASTLSSHDTCFSQTADSLFFMHEGLQQARAPVFDVPSAVEVLLTGGYKRLPKCIENIGIQSTLPEDQLEPALKKLNTLLRSKLLEISLPKEISEVKVSDGTAIFRVKGEFEVCLTLGYRGHLSLWRILHLKLLIGEKNRLVKLEETRRHALGDDLERRMAVADNPFMLLYTVLHEFCVALVMDTVLRQVQVLRQGRWKDAIRFELISDGNQPGNAAIVQLGQDAEIDSSGQRTPGLKIIYWLDFEKKASGSASSSSPFIKIEPGQDLQIRCLHSSFVLDPLTDKEAEFSLDQSCIDVEKLILRAIACNKHTRLLEIQRQLSQNAQIYQASGDVILKHVGDEADTDERKVYTMVAVDEGLRDEVLHVRAYNISYITLGISIRNGHFLLQTTEDIIAASALLECEEALNLGSMTTTEIFIILRSKSILHLFASIGRSLGLKVYEQCLNTLKIPKSILTGSDLLLMEFPQCGSYYYLLMQLDKDFKPLFNLLETQSDEKSHLVSDVNHVSRSNKIDINQIHLVEDESNLTLLNWDKMHCLPSEGTPDLLSENDILSDFGLESTLQLPGCSQGKFSSIVDEVFKLEKGGSGTSFLVQYHPSSSFNASSFSQLSSLSTTHQGMKAGDSIPKLEGGKQQSQISNVPKLSGASSLNSSQFIANNSKGLHHTNALSSPSPARNSYNQRLSVLKSEQDLSSLKSPHFSEVGLCSAMDEEQSRQANESPEEGAVAGGSRPTQLLSPFRAGQTSELGFPCTSGCDGVSRLERTSLKRSLSEILMLMPSMEGCETGVQPRKRRKILESVHLPVALKEPSSLVTEKPGGYVYGRLLADANHGLAPSNIYISVLHHVVRHCSLCIKHARLTSQMDALDIPYVEEAGLRTPSSSLWFRLPFAREDSWKHICLRLGKPGSMYWDVKINDPHFRELWELCKGNTSTQWGCGIRIANTSDVDSHIHYDPEGVVLNYKTVEADSIQKLVSDLQRLSNARLFACAMRKLIGIRADDKADDSNMKSESKLQVTSQVNNEAGNKLSEQMRKTFKIEEVGLMSLWFSYGSMPVMAHFVVEWEADKEGCTMHVSPDHLWPHTKFLEDFINGGDVASFLDCIRLTAGPLLSLAAAIPPARMSGPVSSGPSIPKQNNFIPSQGLLPNGPSSNAIQSASAVPAVTPSIGSHSLHSAATLSAAIRVGSGTVPSSLLPIDVSIVLRGPYWIRIIYRKKFAIDMCCFAGDQVWLQPATPPKGGPSAGGSLPCPQFRPFIMEHVAQGLNALEPNFPGGAHGGGHMNSTNNNSQSSGTQPLVANVNRPNVASGGGMSRQNVAGGSQAAGSMNRISNAILSSSGMPAGVSGVPLRVSPGTGVPVHVRGELNTAFIGLGDDGGYGGGWVPLAALKKMLRGILKYLGVLWLFAQLPDLLKEILGSIFKENEGALLNLDQDQPALRFFVGSYVFAVSVHRVQLLLQVLSVKRFHTQQQQQAQASAQEELSTAEINEISDYFSRGVASEPYDVSRVASFITLLTLPISVLREFLKLIAWKKGLSQTHGGDIASAQRARIELCLENHSGSLSDDNTESSSASRSNIHHDRAHSSVDFALTFVLDHINLPHINAAGGAAWLPYCVSVRLKYQFGENTHVTFLEMNGSHGGRACWSQVEDWEKCKQRLVRTVEYANGNSVGDTSQGRLRLLAEALQRALQASLQQLRDGPVPSSSTGT